MLVRTPLLAALLLAFSVVTWAVPSRAQGARTGHLSVRGPTGAGATVYVDGVSKGSLPWDGDLESGPHEVVARSATQQSARQTVEIRRGETSTLDVQLGPILGRVGVATADRKGLVSIDGKVVGEGAFDGDLPVGEHVIHIERAGYTTIDKPIALHDGESYSETFTMVAARASASTDPWAPRDGFIGGVKLAGAFQVNSINGDFSEPCSFASSPAASSCSAGSPAGGAVIGYFGYMVYPFAVEVLAGGQMDTASASLTPAGSKTTETFTTPRIGGFVAPRARITGQTGRYRFSFAAGVGLAVREIDLSTDGLGGLFKSSDPGGTYVAPAITLDGSVYIRATPKVAVGAGLMYWAESAGSGVLAIKGPYLTQPAYIASAAQVFLLPYLGIELGP